MSKRVEYLVMDVDGTLTDGKIYMGPDGEVMKAFDIKDGYGIHDLLILTGVTPVIITGRCSDIVRNRCEELEIRNLFQGVHDKLETLNEFLDKKGSNLANVAYIGDDMNDYLCMKAIKEAGGLTGCPKDSVLSIRHLVDYKCKKRGGEGAVREFIEFILKHNETVNCK